MKLIEIWKRLGKQPLRVTQYKEAIIFVGDNEYEITNIRYDGGKFIGFEAKPRKEWFSLDIKPKEDTWIIVKDKNGKEYKDYQWKGHVWYEFVRSKDGCDGWRADMRNMICWRYDDSKKEK